MRTWSKIPSMRVDEFWENTNRFAIGVMVLKIFSYPIHTDATSKADSIMNLIRMNIWVKYLLQRIYEVLHFLECRAYL